MAPTGNERQDEFAKIRDEVEHLYASRRDVKFTPSQQQRYLGLLERERVLLDEDEERRS